MQTQTPRMPHCRLADFTDEYRSTVCKIGQGSDCCRYLTMGAGGWGCAKRTNMALTIDGRASGMVAKGDNCDGVYEPRKPYRLLKDRFEIPAGAIIYEQRGYDYGLSSDDERATGVPHTTMTLEPSGDYPGFTVPNSDFEPVAEAEAA